MPTMNHTPGPWVAEQRSFGYPDVTGGPIRRLWDVRAADGTPVASGTIATENEVNARLIAAAPDLLAALDRGRRLAMVVGYDDEESARQMQDWGEGMARIAIRKALGQ